MELLKNLFKVINITFPFADFLYILQLEEYFNKNFITSSLRLFLRRNIQKRDRLKWTSRIKTTFTIALELYVFTLIFGILTSSLWIIMLATIGIPIYILIANIILTPLYNTIKNQICAKSAKFMQTYSKAQVIGVAGSFGKTTTKNLIYDMIRYNYKTQMVPGNLNTPIGIAVWLLNNFETSTEYLIVEMDAFIPGAIANICKITPPNIAILTNVGDQHMTRFRSKEELNKASNEVFEYSQHNAMNITQKDIKATNKYKQFSKSVNECIAFAILVAKKLNISNEFIEDAIKSFELPDRRQKCISMNGFEVIDDSYNISLTTAKAGIDAAYKLAKKKKKKLLVITAGIPEAENSEKENKSLGSYLSSKADSIIVLKSIFSELISLQLPQKSNLKNDFHDAWEYIQKTYKPKDIIILLQPELTDLYY